MRDVIPGACDSHLHVFGPYERFPLAPERSYTPPEASAAALRQMLDGAGLERAVLIQPSAYGFDYSALLDALQGSPDRLRGVAVIDRTTPDPILEKLHTGGVRAARFTDTGGAGKARFTGAVGLEEFERVAPRLASLGWHAVLWASIDRLLDVLPQMSRFGVPLVLDHLAMLDVGRGLADHTFQTLLSLVRDGSVWVKLTPQRCSQQFPDYPDVKPFHEALVSTNPARLLWGSDWPFLRMGERTPTTARLLALLQEWIDDRGICEQILRRNPAELYDFPQVSSGGG